MAYFGPKDTDGNPLSVDVYPARVMVSRAKANGANAPIYANWVAEDRLQVQRIFRGSSIGGPSYAKLKFITGLPDIQTDVELADALLPGDRVAIYMDDGSHRWLFGGYMVTAQIGIEEESETLVYTCAGPEWAWGAGSPNGRAGAMANVFGQLRRTADADDDYNANPAIKTPYAGLFQFADEPAVFNPNGRRNMSGTNCVLSAAGISPPIDGAIWELPDRRIGIEDKADWWTKLAAVKTLIAYYNDPAQTGVNMPDWDKVMAVIGLGKVIRDVNVDGLGLWEALRKVLEPEYGFYISTVPTKVENNTWGGFEFRVFDRSKDADGTSAKLHLDLRGTSIAEATPSVVRLAAINDIAKTANAVTVLGKAMRHIRLQYWGGKTPTLAAAQKKLALQHGWHGDEGNLSDFANVGKTTVEAATVDASANRQQWLDRYVSKGKEFPKYAHVFRLFAWNEAFEWTTARGVPVYAPATAFAWYAPDLSGIADSAGFAPVGDPTLGKYYRRRRRLLDTVYLDGVQVDTWRRVPPTLYVAAVSPTDDNRQSPWVRLDERYYKLDPQRAAVWMTEEDLAQWYPFSDEENPDESTVQDGRSFATLLLTGKLRMLLEATIETDNGLAAVAPRTNDSGSPHVRRVVIRTGDGFVSSAQYNDGVTSPCGMTPAPLVDALTDARQYAEQLRQAGQDEQIHASILVAATWAEQAIGKMVTTIAGRDIKLTATSGRGTQVVALNMDLESNKWELLTESAAMELRHQDRLRLVKRPHREARGTPDRMVMPGAPGDGI